MYRKFSEVFNTESVYGVIDSWIFCRATLIFLLPLPALSCIIIWLVFLADITHAVIVYMVSGTRDNPPRELPWARYFFHSFVYNILSTVYMRWARQLGRARQLGEASCLASAGRVALAGETTFSHGNSLARLPETRQQSLKCARIK